MKGPRWLITEHDARANRVLVAKLVCRENPKAALWQGKHTVFITDYTGDCHDLEFWHDGDLASVHEAAAKAYGSAFPEMEYDAYNTAMATAPNTLGFRAFASVPRLGALRPEPETSYRWVVLLRYMTLEGALRAGERLMGLPETRILPHGRGWKEEA